jgi:hypothetical protein
MNFYKIFSISIILLFIVGCSSSPSHQSFNGNEEKINSNIFGKLSGVEVNGKYRFTSFSIDPNKKGLYWESLSNDKKRHVGAPPRVCGVGTYKNVHGPVPHCDDFEDDNDDFYSLSLIKSKYVYRVILAPLLFGVPLFGAHFEYAFDPEDYSDALDEAVEDVLNKVSVKELNEAYASYISQKANPEYRFILKKEQELEIKAPFSDELIRVLSVDEIEYSSINELVSSLTSSSAYMRNLQPQVNKFLAQINAREQQLLEIKKEEERRLSVLKLETYKKEFLSLSSSIESYRSFLEKYGAYDPLGKKNSIEEKLSVLQKEKSKQEAAERLRAQEAYELAQLNKENAFKNKVLNYREKLSSGNDSHCGLVVDVKDNVVLVQSMVGSVWIKRSEIYPAGAADCRFYNNVYQPPNGLPI